MSDLIDKAEALLPCPFCGHRAETQEYGTRTEVWAVWCVECKAQMESISTEAEAIAAWNRRAAIPARGVGVKALVWEDFGDWGAKASAYYQANYLIQFWKGREQFEVALSYPGYQTGFDGERWHHTLDAAKAAAQADYEARILAALEPVTQPAPDAAAIREAALREAARLVSARCDAYVAEHGSYDYSTGTTEYPGDGAEWVEEWTDIESAILALIQKEPPNDRA